VFGDRNRAVELLRDAICPGRGGGYYHPHVPDLPGLQFLLRR
jgi:hypothetical protein